MFKKTLMTTLIVLSFSAVAVAATDNSNKVANDYDCTIDELKSYMGKKTESLVQRKTAISKFEDFKKSQTAKTSAANAGSTEMLIREDQDEDCNYFWGDLEDIKYEPKDKSGILDAILTGDLNTIVNTAKDRMIDVAEGLATEIVKGVCKRLSTENVTKQATSYGNKVMKTSTGGYGIDDVTDPDLNDLINDGLKAGFGSSGKLINIMDPSLDKQRSNAILKETDNQVNKMLLY